MVVGAVARRRRDIEQLLWAAVGEMTEELAAHPSTRRVVGETQSSHMIGRADLLTNFLLRLGLFTEPTVWLANCLLVSCI